jgi:hypothetical protein
MFISNTVFTWEPVLEGLSGTSDDWDLSYTYLRHSEDLFRHASDKRHFLIDVISNLKRAVDHRTKHISKTYKIKKTSCYAKHKNVWDTLAELDVIKQVMLSKLIEIRNAIEHQFSDPPSQARCIELAEFVWYFLKSTDQIAKQVSDGPGLCESFDSPYAIRYEGIPENDWKSSISACLPGELVSADPRADCFEISEETVQTGHDYKAALLTDLQNGGRLNDDNAALIARYRDDDMIVTGKLNDTGVDLWFLKLYFRTT